MSTDRSPRGASPVGDPEERRRKGFPLWLAALLGLLILGLILFLLLRGDGNDAETSPATPDSRSSTDAAGSEAPSSGAGSASEATTDAAADPTEDADGSASPLATEDAGTAGQPGTLTAAGQALLPLPAGGLGEYADQPAEARGVVVQSVVADEGFWVGDSEEDRIFAFLEIGGESAPQIVAGQPVTFNGTLRAIPADPAATFSVSPEDGLDQLTQQGHYLEVTEVTETP